MIDHDEKYPVILYGGPQDGLELDVRKTEEEIRRPTESKKHFASYIRIGPTAFVFQGYISNKE